MGRGPCLFLYERLFFVSAKLGLLTGGESPVPSMFPQENWAYRHTPC